MKYDITALGEILIDFTPSGKDSAGDLIFARKAAAHLLICWRPFQNSAEKRRL